MTNNNELYIGTINLILLINHKIYRMVTHKMYGKGKG